MFCADGIRDADEGVEIRGCGCHRYKLLIARPNVDSLMAVSRPLTMRVRVKYLEWAPE